MSNVIAQGQAANVMPPVKNKVCVITLDATSRIYDLGSLSFGDYPLDAGGDVFLTLQAGVAFHYFFSADNAGTVDETVATAAGAAIAFSANACWSAVANVPESVRVNRTLHRYLVVKGAGAGTLRIRASSDSTGRR